MTRVIYNSIRLLRVTFTNVFSPKGLFSFAGMMLPRRVQGSPSTHPMVWHFCPLCSATAPLMEALPLLQRQQCRWVFIYCSRKKKLKTYGQMKLFKHQLELTGWGGEIRSLYNWSCCSDCTPTPWLHCQDSAKASTQPLCRKKAHLRVYQTQRWSWGCLFPDVQILTSNCTSLWSCCLSLCLCFPRAAGGADQPFLNIWITLAGSKQTLSCLTLQWGQDFSVMGIICSRERRSVFMQISIFYQKEWRDHWEWHYLSVSEDTASPNL